MIYHVFGLVLSADRAIPGLTPIREAVRPSLHVCFDRRPDGSRLHRSDAAPWYVSPYQDDSGAALLTAWELEGGAYLQFCYCDGTEFVVDRSGTHVWAAWRDPLTFADVVSYLLGPMMGVVLRLRGVLCLHASGVVFDGTAVAFVGREGAGKSTTAAAFAELGYPVLSDDIVPLSDEGITWRAYPGYPRLRLWPSSVDLLAALSAFPRLPAGWGDRRYHVDFERHGYQFQQQPVELRTIYLLDERAGDPRSPYIEAVSPQTAWMTLVSNTFANRMLDRHMRAREFDQVGRLLDCVPVRRIRPHADPAALARLCDLILEDAHVRQPARRPVAAAGSGARAVRP